MPRTIISLILIPLVCILMVRTYQSQSSIQINNGGGSGTTCPSGGQPQCCYKVFHGTHSPMPFPADLKCFRPSSHDLNCAFGTPKQSDSMFNGSYLLTNASDPSQGHNHPPPPCEGTRACCSVEDGGNGIGLFCARAPRAAPAPADLMQRFWNCPASQSARAGLEMADSGMEMANRILQNLFG